MSIFDDVNELSAEAVLSRINLPLAKDGKSYICPLCEHGKGGDGIRPRKSNGTVRWKCFGCDKDFSNFDLAAATLGLDAEFELAESARRVAELFGIFEGEETLSFSRGKKSSPTAWTAEAKAAASFDKKGAVEVDKKGAASDAKPKNYAKFYEVNRANVKKFLEEQGGNYRGLTSPTFEKYGLAVHPEFGVEGHEKCPHLIIPYDDTHFTARAVTGHDRSQHGEGAGLYETLPIKTERSCVNFIVEGEIDALSIAQVMSGFGTVGCVATGGASKYRKVVPEFEKRFADSEHKPRCIVMFDNDKAGVSNGLNLVAELKAAGYPAVICRLEERLAGEYECHKSDGTIEKFTAGKLDANDLLQQGETELINRLWQAAERAEEDLGTQAEVLKKSAEQARQAALDKSGMKISSFTEYFAADFFRDIELTTKYSGRKTGFENLDAAQVFMPGLYVLGALPATGKTTFAWQLLNQLADNGEPCIYCSYEMSRVELYTKSMAREFYKENRELSEELNLSSVNIRRGAGKDLEQLQKQAERFAKSKTNLRVAELSNTGIAELIEKLKPLVADADKPAVICIDYLQIVPSKDARQSSTKEKVDDIMLRLKDFQRETNSTLIVISSFNRDNYYQSASFSSFKESGSIEYSADCVWALEFSIDGVDKPERKDIIKASKEKIRKIKLSCLKNRNGGQYECFFSYHASRDYFEPLETKDEETPSTPVRIHGH